MLLVEPQVKKSILDVVNGIDAIMGQPTAAGAIWEKDDSGLFGKDGLALFYAYLYLHSANEAHADKALTLVDESSAYRGDPSLGCGMSGSGWLIQHLSNIKFLDETEVENLGEVDRFVDASLVQDQEHKNYDLLYGLVGKGIYYLERLPVPAAKAALETIVRLLDGFSIKEGEYIYWRDYYSIRFNNDNQAGDVRYNLGLAHGVPAIISLLSKVHRQGILTEMTKALLEGSVRWLLSKQKPVGHSLFPGFADADSHSRLGWCYGDLCVAVALWHAGKALDRDSFREEATRIALAASERDLERAYIMHDATLNIYDATFCHGLAGLAYIFNRFYDVTQNKKFEERALYWLTHTLAARSPREDGIAGYLMYHHDKADRGGWRSSFELLEGVSGIGLVLLSFVSDVKPAWGGLFMTDLD